MKRSMLFLSLSLCCLSAANAEGTLRCNGKIIRVGQPASYVLEQCGAPHDKVIHESVGRASTVHGLSRAVGLAESEQWIYNRGWGKFPALLVFFEGNVRRIEHLRDREGAAPRGHSTRAQ